MACAFGRRFNLSAILQRSLSFSLFNRRFSPAKQKAEGVSELIIIMTYEWYDRAMLYVACLINGRGPGAGNAASIHTDVSAAFNTYHCMVFQYVQLLAFLSCQLVAALARAKDNGSCNVHVCNFNSNLLTTLLYLELNK